jgi:hypothetical protein
MRNPSTVVSTTTASCARFPERRISLASVRSSIGVSDIEPERSCWFQNLIDFSKDLLQMLDMEFKRWFKTKLASPSTTFLTELTFVFHSLS